MPIIVVTVWDIIEIALIAFAVGALVVGYLFSRIRRWFFGDKAAD